MSDRKRYGVQRDSGSGWQVVDADDGYEPVARCWGFDVESRDRAHENATRIARLLNDEEDMRVAVNNREGQRDGE